MRNTQCTLCSQICLNMPRSGKVGVSRQGDVQAASMRRGLGNIIHFAHQFLPTKQLHFRSLPDNTVVYSNLLINIPQCGIRENTHTVTRMCSMIKSDLDGAVNNTFAHTTYERNWNRCNCLYLIIQTCINFTPQKMPIVFITLSYMRRMLCFRVCWEGYFHPAVVIPSAAGRKVL